MEGEGGPGGDDAHPGADIEEGGRPALGDLAPADDHAGCPGEIEEDRVGGHGQPSTP